MIATKATLEHALYIAENMRQQDVIELKKLDSTPLGALTDGLVGQECFTLLVDEQPIMMFGMKEHGFDSAIIWALGTDEVLKHKKEFLIQSIRWRDTYLKEYSTLFNHVDVENKISIRWLKWLGATFGKPYFLGQNKFMRFEFNV